MESSIEGSFHSELCEFLELPPEQRSELLVRKDSNGNYKLYWRKQFLQTWSATRVDRVVQRKGGSLGELLLLHQLRRDIEAFESKVKDCSPDPITHPDWATF